MKDLEDIKLKDFKNAMREVMGQGHNSVAPLGMAGDRFYLHKHVNPDQTRVQQVSIRLYCGDPELLITNNSKTFLFYGRYDIRLGFDFVAKEYFRMFKRLRDAIPNDTTEEKDMVVCDNAHKTIGWKMLDALFWR